MKLVITGRHFDVTESLKSYLGEKFLRLDKYANDIINMQVVLEMQKRNAVVETNLKLKKFSLNIKETDQDMYKAIDKSFDTIKKQLVRHEKKMKSHRNKKGEE